MSKVEAIIEIPLNYHAKYELKDGVLWLDRVSTEEYPCNYGFLPGTLWHDGDALDICVVGHLSLHPQTHIMVEPKAVIKMYDNGVSDFKVVAGLEDTTRVQSYLESLVSFFERYKPGVEVDGVITEAGKVAAVIAESRELIKV